MNELVTSAIETYRSDGVIALGKAGIRFGWTGVISRPVLHYMSPIEFIFTPNVRYVRETKLYDAPFWLDRYLELKNFYQMSHRELCMVYLSVGFPNHPLWARKMHGRDRAGESVRDQQASPTPDELLEKYRRKHFESNNRFMLGYHRYGIAEQYFNLVHGEVDPADVAVLDYGCGVADPALYCATAGADATIVDLDTKVLDFAIWRFEQRDIAHHHYRAGQTEFPVNIPHDDTYDFIVMSEFLEHVRNPLVFLEFVIEHLETDGVFYDPVGREYTHTVGGDHLVEAKDVVESDEYQRLHRQEFERLDGHFYRKT